MRMLYVILRSSSFKTDIYVVCKCIRGTWHIPLRNSTRAATGTGKSRGRCFACGHHAFCSDSSNRFCISIPTIIVKQRTHLSPAPIGLGTRWKKVSSSVRCSGVRGPITALPTSIGQINPKQRHEKSGTNRTLL